MGDVTYSLPHDASNIFSLPGAKKLKKDEKNEKAGQKGNRKKKIPLSNKKRKKLQKIVDKKKKKFTRVEILEKLRLHQIGQDEIDLFSSVARLEQKEPKRKADSSKNVQSGINTVQGSKRKKYCNTVSQSPIDQSKLTSSGPYFETDSETSSCDEEMDFKSATVTQNKNSSPEPTVSQNELADRTVDPLNSSVKNELNAPPGNYNTRNAVDECKVDLGSMVSEQCKPLIDDKSRATKECKVAKFVLVNRTAKMQEQRLKLPILGMEQEIMEAINENPTVIICGATGSGKTTQVPQFLYEGGYCSGRGLLIGVTEPRRVAATSMARRVGQELDQSEAVSYQIRYEGDVTEKTRVKFMTDGVLLRELKADFLLSKYSAILIDEAHERSIFSDILIGLLSRVVPLRKKRHLPDLKLIVMSATLRIDDFLSPTLFPTRPPVLDVESRQFSVSTHFNRQTPGAGQFLMAALKKCRQIHRKLPSGGILVFVPGQREVKWLVHRLRRAFPSSGRGVAAPDEECDQSEPETSKRKRKPRLRRSQPIKLEQYKLDTISTCNATRSDSSKKCGSRFDRQKTADEHDSDWPEEIGADSDWSNENQDDSSHCGDDSDWSDEDGEDDGISGDCSAGSPMHILPLYALLSVREQRRVFEEPPADHRLCVVATNVAETSLTIPNVKYVVDTGREKTRVYDPITGVSKFVTQWVSKASAEQRTGRAGRTSPGHCYRLYSSAVFEEFLKFSEPEILSKPADDLVLVMKNMNIVKVVNFPFPTAPSPQVLGAAEERLCKLGALARDVPGDPKSPAKITPLGRTMALMPVSPGYAKMLALGHQQNLLPYVVCMVSALSVREPLVNLSSLAPPDGGLPMDQQGVGALIGRHLEIRRQWASGSEDHFLLGDVACLLGAVLDAERSTNFAGLTLPDESFSKAHSAGLIDGQSSNIKPTGLTPNLAQFCAENGMRPQALLEIRRMRRQLTLLLTKLYPGLDLAMDPGLRPPSRDQACALRQLMLGGLGAQVARRLPDLLPTALPDGQGRPEKTPKNAYQCSNGLSDFVFIHPTSILRKNSPDFVIFQEIIETTEKKFLFNVTAIEPEWLCEAAQAYCRFGEPLDDPEPSYDPQLDTIVCQQNCLFGEIGWKMGVAKRPYPEKSAHFYKLIAKCFLNGEIFPELSRYKKSLLCNPGTMLKSWAPKLQREKVEFFLKLLMDNKIDGKAKFLENFVKNKKFLLEEYCRWLPESKHQEIRMIWPPGD